MKISHNSGELGHVLGGLDPHLARVFVPWALHHPRKLWAYGRLVRAYRHSVQVRQDDQANGVTVPPFLILSVTSRCNLTCVGCYATAVGTVHRKSIISDAPQKPPFSLEQWRGVIREARDLGVFGFIIAGGEPFMLPGLLSLCSEFRDQIFIIFTNGTAIKDADFSLLRRLPNVVVVVSIEGSEDMTDLRRGQGVHAKALATLDRLTRAGVVSGISVTVSRLNYAYWMDPAHVDALIAQGVRFGFFIEFIPSSPQIHSIDSALPSVSRLGEEASMLSPDERASFRQQILEYRASKFIYLIHSPGDEELVGGCISAGRGFAHVTPDGDLTPCPVSNIATHNLATASLREGLQSPLFKIIRDSEHLLETGETPCALFAHPEEVAAIAKSIGAYRTGAAKHNPLAA
ncbi:MAG TPA: radical SAM protein [Candidatus Lokiarchaeia archaeon]|nr:radical SAM protein [Candidatus Lokiarchaeia archaeon]